MSYPHPVYCDGDHLYTICRDGAAYAITMIPIAQGLGGVGHIISTGYTRHLPGALHALRQLAREAGMTRITTKATRTAATVANGIPKESTTVYPHFAGLSREA